MPSSKALRSKLPDSGIRCSERGNFAILFDRVSKIDRRMGRIESAVNDHIVEQRIATGRIESTLEHVRGDLARHDREIVEVETAAHRLEVSSAERSGRMSVAVGLAKSVWSAKQYWLIPILAAAAGYLSTYLR